MTKSDLNNRLDVERLVNIFYRKILVDDFLAPHFIKVDWRTHFCIMYDYWFSILFDVESSSRGTLQKYINLNIKSDQLERWLSLFIDTVDENFEGVNAEKAKRHAENMVAVSHLA